MFNHFDLPGMSILINIFFVFRFLRWDIKPMDEVKETLDEIEQAYNKKTLAESRAEIKKDMGIVEKTLNEVSYCDIFTLTA